MKIRNVAVICSESISNGLMMMVASHRFYQEGASVITFHDRLEELKAWFPGHAFSPRLPIEKLVHLVQDFDLVVIQYDGSSYSKQLIQILRNSTKPELSVFYPAYCKYARSSLTKWDRIFDPQRPMVDNIAFAVASLLQQRDHSKNNGLLPPHNLTHRKYPRQVAIYSSPTHPVKYEKIAREVERCGFKAVFLRPELLSRGASIIYESGYFIGPESDLCHLASNLQIPTLVVSGKKKPLSLWKPGWLQSSFITPPRWIPHARECFIFTPRVIRAFKQLIAKDKIYV